MGLLLIILSFLAITILVNNLRKKDIISSIIYSLLFTSLLILASTEGLSLLNSFNYLGLFIFWSVVALILAMLILKNRRYLQCTKRELTHLIQGNKTFSIILSIFLVLICFQGLIYPPNNWDSMAYHLGRIVHWVANSNVDTYPTHIYRQIYDPPFAEFWVAQVCILSRTDLFASSVQLLFTIGSLACIIGICREFNFSKIATFIAFVFAFTTPEILLQSSSTQNDVVESFFILSSILFLIKAYKTETTNNTLLGALSAGLAILTKGTAYIYLPLVFLFFGAFYFIKAIKNKRYNFLLKIAFIPVIILSINLGYYYRNYKLTDKALGIPNENYFNESMSGKKAFLLVIKNMALHWAVTPLVHPLTHITDNVVKELHEMLGEDLGDPENNYAPFSMGGIRHHEDNASNFPQVVMIIISLVLFIKYKRYKTIAALLFLFPLLEFVLFSLVLKYQPWHSRLQTPMFFMFAIPVGTFFTNGYTNNLFKKIILFLVIFYGFCVIVFNPSRPYITCGLTNKIRMIDTRFDKRFTGRTYVKHDYQEVKKFIKEHEDQENMGIVMCGDACDTWEYPLYFDIFSSQKKYVVPHLNVANPSKNAIWNAVFDKSKIEFILSDTKPDSIVYNGYSYNKTITFDAYSVYQKQVKH
jgi:hypothetical protein